MKVFKIFLLIGLFGTIVYFVLNKLNSGKKSYITFYEVKKSSVKSSLFMSGTIIFRKQAVLSAEVNARVHAILVSEGDFVKAGQELIVLDSEEVEKQLKQREMEVESSRIEIKRAKEILKTKTLYKDRLVGLFASNAIDVIEVETAMLETSIAEFDVKLSQNALKTALINYQLAFEHVKRNNIKAPIDGVIIDIPIGVGETAISSSKSIAGSSLLVIADLRSYEAHASISEFNIERIKVGSKVNIRMRSRPSETYIGEVIRIGRSVEQDINTSNKDSKHTIAVTVAFMNKKLSLIGGTSCEMEIVETASSNSLAIPVGAVKKLETYDNERNYIKGKTVEHFVFVVKNGVAYRQTVTVGPSDGEMQVIYDGILSRDIIVTGPAYFLSTLKHGDSLDFVNTAAF